MRINAAQKLEVEIDPIEFILKLQTQIAGRYFSSCYRAEDNYFIKCYDTRLSNPWYDRIISEN